jgi:hypothetical protein
MKGFRPIIGHRQVKVYKYKYVNGLQTADFLASGSWSQLQYTFCVSHICNIYVKINNYI